MEPRYSRNIPALSEEECALLQTKRIAIIGCGGLGGHLIDLAARIGFGAIRAVDGDVFEESNLNRQLLCDCSQLGKSKAQAAAAHIHRVNPQISCEGIAVMLNADNAAELLAGCDLVFDALDSIESRRLLAYAAAASNLPVAYGAIRGWVAQAALYLPGEPFTRQTLVSATKARSLSRQRSALRCKCLWLSNISVVAQSQPARFIMPIC